MFQRCYELHFGEGENWSFCCRPNLFAVSENHHIESHTVRYRWLFQMGLRRGQKGDWMKRLDCFSLATKDLDRIRAQKKMVEPRGLEPLTPTMPLWCSTN